MEPEKIPQLTTSNKKLTLHSLVIVVGIIGPLMTIPQIYQIWVVKQKAGVSLWTWGLYLLETAIWLWYGLKIKSTPIIVSCFIWVLMDAAVVLGLLVK